MDLSTMRIMAIGAHPDDLEILCGGTLAKFVDKGHHVTMCHVTLGDRGSFVHSREEIAEIRDTEARSAAAVIGAHYLALGIPDGEVDATSHNQRLTVTDAIRQARPDVILAHSPNDYMSDHNEASKLALDCSFLATLPLFETEHPHNDSIPALVHMETVTGNDFLPTEFVDVSDYFDSKVAMLSQHRSQLDWLSDHDGADMVEQIRTVSRYRGLQCGVQYAEGFVPSTVWLRARTQRMLP